MELVLRSIVVLLSLFPFSSPAIHSLKYINTATKGNIDLPEFVDATVVDGVMVGSYDSYSQKLFPKQEWVKDLDQHEWNAEILRARRTEKELRKLMNTLKHINQTQGAHVYQRMCGCQWDEDSGTTYSYEQYGYDGKDFLSLDMEQMSWISHVPEAQPYQLQRNENKQELRWLNHYLNQECIDKLKKYVAYGSSALRRKVPPRVSLFEDTVPSAHYHKVVCHATGFYPDDVVITWKKDGKEILKDVDVGETLPNDDGTFQRRAVLLLSHGDWVESQYTCEVAHKSGEAMSRPLMLQEDSASCLSLIVTAVAVSVTLTIAVVVGIVWWSKNRPGYKKASMGDEIANGKA